MAMILVIDDELELRLLLAKALQRAGHEVLTASNGNEALALMRRTRADLVITDILMPEKEGLETIRELGREFPHVLLIAISGGGALDPTNYLSCAQRFGADRAFAKPFKLGEILAAVEEFLDPTLGRPASSGS